MGYGIWGGQTCNPYDTERVPRGTSNGSGVSVAANLVTCSICEQTSASCKGPASRNNVVNLLATKGVMMDGGPGHSNPGDRAGIHCRTVGDAVRLLDAVKGFDSKDIFTAIPPGIIPKEPYSSFVVDAGSVASKPLQGMRIGVVREFMVKHTKNDVAISDQLDKEIKTVLRDKLGAELVESFDPLYGDDSTVPNIKYTFQDALKEILPAVVPEFFQQTTSSGELEFAVHGWDVKSTDYLIALALGKAPLSDKLNLRRISSGGYSNAPSGFAMNEYLRERGDARVKDQASLTANAKSERLPQIGGSSGTESSRNSRATQSSISYLKMQMVMRMVIQKVMSENHIDAFVNPEQTTPPYKLGGPGEPEVNNRPSASCCMGFTALIGAPEIDVPAGYDQIAYDPQYVLSEDRKTYIEVTGTTKSMLPNPMPVSLMFWAGPGNEPALIKSASAYEEATHHRVSPKDFGPVPGEP
jgi:Asp-tRNA(Asn)/Glu-tRNA(Gln) amidotransferase A subunit family amidase